jgi:tetrahydromethanopterin S-methyltransferase subunit G
MVMDVEAEIRDLKRRVGEIEGSFGFLTQQVKSVHKDLLAFQAITEQRFDKVDRRLDKVDGRLDKIDGRVDRLEKGLRTLREDMPGIVGSTMRNVLRERPRKSRKT